MPTERVRGVLESGPVNVGDPAPDFQLPALIGGVRKSFRLNEYRGKTIVMAFYPFNWQDASVQQMAAYQAQRPRLLAANAETVRHQRRIHPEYDGVGAGKRAFRLSAL